MAVFGQLEFHVSDAGRLILGMRAERRDVDYVDSSGLESRTRGKYGRGRAVLHCTRFSDELTGFATLSRGYKGGGFNLGFVPPGRREFAQESMWNAEVGVKSSLAADRLLLSASVFLQLT